MRLLTCVIFMVLTLPAFGQQAKKGIVQGLIVDELSQSPLDYATVSIYSAQDSSLATGGITDETGRFNIEVKPGRYYAELTFISYQTQNIGDIEISSRQMTFDLGVVGLRSDAAVLAEVEVRAERSRMQMALDKRIFNVGKDLANTGGSAAEVLDNVPSVSVDVEGNVSLRGSGGVRILIDGKPSGLIGISNTDGLRQIPANLIDRVEVITNPSARYEAEGMAGVINIVLKKERKKGLNGSFDLSGGLPKSYGAAINLNYRKEKFNFFANYGYSYRQSPGTGSLYQENYRDNSTFILDQTRDRVRTGKGSSIRTGADYSFNEKNILTTAFTYRDGRDKNRTTLIYRDFIDSFANPTGISERTDEETELEPNLEYSMTYRKNFDKKDHTLTFDLRYQDNTEQEKSNIREAFFDGEYVAKDDADLLQRSLNNESERLLIGQIDYVHPFAEEGRFEAGYRGSIRRIDNDYLVEELQANQWANLDNLSNDFNYDEDIHAAYAIFGNKYGKFSFQLGARLEYSDVTTLLLQTEENNKRNYLNFFPSAFFTYDLPGQNAVQISYSRRLNRPRFRELNPFFSFSDSRNFRSGNPNLDPEFTHSMELGHIKYWDNASLASSIYFRHTDGVIENIRSVDDEGISFSQPQNLATQDSYGMEFTFSVSPKKWWDIDGNWNFFRAQIKSGEINNQSLQADTYGWFGRLTSKVKVNKSLDTQLRFNYRGPRNSIQGRNKAYYYLDLAMSKEVFKNTGTLTLSVNDLLNSRRYRYIAQGFNFYTEGDFQWRNRSLRLTLNYRLNQDKKRGRGERRGGGDGGDFDGGGEFGS